MELIAYTSPQWSYKVFCRNNSGKNRGAGAWLRCYALLWPLIVPYLLLWMVCNVQIVVCNVYRLVQTTQVFKNCVCICRLMMQLMMMEYSTMCYTWNDLGTYVAGLHKVCNETQVLVAWTLSYFSCDFSVTVSVLSYFFGCSAIGILYSGLTCVLGHNTECLWTHQLETACGNFSKFAAGTVPFAQGWIEFIRFWDQKFKGQGHSNAS